MDDLPLLRLAASEIFGGEIDISQRAASALLEARQSFSLFGRHVSITTNLEVFAHAVAGSPACSDLLLRNNIPLVSPRVDPGLIGSSQAELSIRRSYNQLLREMFIEPLTGGTELNTAGLFVQSSRFLSEMDIFAGTLEQGRRALKPSPTVEALFHSQRMISPVTGIITESGEEMLDRLLSVCRQWGNIDPSHGQQQLIVFLDDVGQLRVRAFGASSVGSLQEKGFAEQSFIYRAGVVQQCSPYSPYAPNVLAELESLINSKNAKEQDFQRFFERNPAVLAGLDYANVHAHPVLFKDDGNRLIPDFLLEKIDTGWHALLDLKLPNKNPIIRKRNRTYFAQWIHEAIAQLQFYREWFEAKENRLSLASALKMPFEVFRPKIVLVAGRKHHFGDEVERLQLLGTQDRNLEFWTYDDLLSRAQRYHRFLQSFHLRPTSTSSPSAMDSSHPASKEKDWHWRAP